MHIDAVMQRDGRAQRIKKGVRDLCQWKGVRKEKEIQQLHRRGGMGGGVWCVPSYLDF